LEFHFTKCRTQLLHATPNSVFHRAFGLGETGCDLPVGQAFEVRQLDRHALQRRELCESFADRSAGVGVELLVEPWELGIRKAKEFLLTGDKIDAQEAWRLGMVNRVVPRDSLASAAREMADKVALVPAITAQSIKESINHTFEVMGKRESWKYHFLMHQFVSNTETALSALAARKQKGSMKEVFAEHEDGGKK